MSDDAIVSALTVAVVVAFAVLVTVHTSAVFGLFRRRHFEAALAAMVVPPLAPWLSWRHGMRGRAIGWCVAAPLYALVLVLGATSVIPLRAEGREVNHADEHP